MSRKVTVSWYHTEEFQREFEVPEGYDPDEDYAEDEDPLLELITNLDQAELTAAFAGCTARVITEVTPIEEAP